MALEIEEHSLNKTYSVTLAITENEKSGILKDLMMDHNGQKKILEIEKCRLNKKKSVTQAITKMPAAFEAGGDGVLTTLASGAYACSRMWWLLEPLPPSPYPIYQKTRIDRRLRTFSP